MSRSIGRENRIATLPLTLIVVIALSGCVPGNFAQSPFDTTAQDAASSMFAAATTLEFLQEGKLNRRYASSSLVVYQQAVDGVASTLPNETGAPDDATLQPVIEHFQRAEAILNDPCLGDECDIQGQIETLRNAGDLLLEVSQ